MRVWQAWCVALCLTGGAAGCSGCSDPASEVLPPGGDTSEVSGTGDASGDGVDGGDDASATDVSDGPDSGGDDGDAADHGGDVGIEEVGPEDVPEVEVDTSLPDIPDVQDVPDVPDTTPPDVGPPPPFEQCLIDMGCDGQPFLKVCDENDPTKQFPNDCYYFCNEQIETGTGSYEGAMPAASEACQPACLFECDPLDVQQPPFCVEDPPGTFTEYPNPYAACCSPGNWTFTDPNVQPGKCPVPGACDAVGCAGAGLKPVCGDDGGTLTTYQNACEAQACGITTLECPAACPDKGSCPQCATPSACEPVCGIDGRTYRNECYAECNTGLPPAYEGVCCDCPLPSAATLVCSTTGKTYGNECLMTCKGEAQQYTGPCVPGCTVDPVNDEPACGFYEGEFTTFPNLSCAEKSGAHCTYEGDCALGTNPCGKTDAGQQYEPLCGPLPGETDVKTWPNLCNASCAGVTDLTSGECQECGLLCPAGQVDDIPHCGPDCVLYPNSCVATKCAGFDLEQLSKNSCPASCKEEPTP